MSPRYARNATDPGPDYPEPTALTHIRVVLVNTAQPRNIGSAARAMKAMGLHRLYLVQPEQFPHRDAHDLASGASDVLAAAVICSSLEQATESCALVFGASARRRELSAPEVTPAQCAELCLPLTAHGAEVALVFGPEAAGLDNAALLRCHYLLQIPANPAFASLNLAQAVQICAYALRMPAIAQQHYQPPHPPAPLAEFDQFFAQLVNTAQSARYFNNKNPDKAAAQLRRIFYRAQASVEELKMLRGLLSQLQHVMKNGG